MKDRFDNFEIQPDEAVWQKIEHTLAVKKRQNLAKKAIIAACGAGAVALALAIPLTHKTNSENIILTQAQPTEVSNSVRIDAPHPQESTNHATIPQNAEGNNSSKPSSVQDNISDAQEEMQAENKPSVSPTPITNSPKSESECSKTPSAPKPIIKAVSQEHTVHAESQSTTPKPTTTKSPVIRPEETQEFAIWIPNAFIPEDPNNEDNHIFKAKINNGAEISNFEMKIFNRAGRLMFSTKNIDQGWDGRFQGALQPMAAYVYVINYRNHENKPVTQKGTVTLIR